ncbi:MAG TPA: CHAD domain-containing protein [Chryseolinea sp.]
MKRFNKFARKQFQALKVHLEAYGGNPDPEVVHEIRVDIKKIKAILQVIAGCSRKRFKAHQQFIPFRAVFRNADAIRKSEVFNALLSNYAGEKIDLPQTNGQELKDFESKVPCFVHDIDEQTKKIKAFLGKVHKKDLRRHLKHLQKEIRAKLYPRLSSKEIHKTRKSIKTVLYISQAMNRLKKRKIAFYDTLQESIGTLHDKQSLLDALSKTGSTETRRALKAAIAHDIRNIKALTTDYYE